MTNNGFADKVKGKVKEVAGDITGDDKKKTEGILEQAKGGVEEIASDIEKISEGYIEKTKAKLKQQVKEQSEDEDIDED